MQRGVLIGTMPLGKEGHALGKGLFGTHCNAFMVLGRFAIVKKNKVLSISLSVCFYIYDGYEVMAVCVGECLRSNNPLVGEVGDIYPIEETSSRF